jgi:transposase
MNRKASQKKKEVGKVKTVKIYFHPDAKQKKMLNEYFTALHKLYNACLDNEYLLKEYDAEMKKYNDAKKEATKPKEDEKSSCIDGKKNTKTKKTVTKKKSKKDVVDEIDAQPSDPVIPVVKTKKEIDELAKEFLTHMRENYIKQASKFYPQIGYDVKEYEMESFLKARSGSSGDLNARKKETKIYKSSFTLHNDFVLFDHGNNYFTFNKELLSKRVSKGEIDSIYFKCTSVDVSFIDLEHECKLVKRGSKYYLSVLVDADTYYTRRRANRSELSKKMEAIRTKYHIDRQPVIDTLSDKKRQLKNKQGDQDALKEDISNNTTILKNLSNEYKSSKDKLLVDHGKIRKQDMELPEDKKLPFIAIDPGIRKFITGYDMDKATLIGRCEDIRSLNEYKDTIRAYQSAISGEDGVKLPKRICEKLNSKILRIYDKINNKINNFHYHVAKYLCINYQTILIPKFGGKDLYSKAIRRIGKTTVKDMTTWSHCSFREILKNKADQYQYVKVIEVPEDYTTKTCSGCGWLNDDIGASETFQCKGQCKGVFDRDINASKNIFLKNKQFLSL